MLFEFKALTLLITKVDCIKYGRKSQGNKSITVQVNSVERKYGEDKTYQVTCIAKNAFRDNKKLTKVTIGSNIITIGDNAFRGCTNLKTVVIGKNVKTIGNKAFYKCTSHATITIPSKVKKIGKSAFEGCKKLKKKGVSKKAKFKKN